MVSTSSITTVNISEACRRADIADYQVRYMLAHDMVPGAFKNPAGRWRIPVQVLGVLRDYVTMRA